MTITSEEKMTQDGFTDPFGHPEQTDPHAHASAVQAEAMEHVALRIDGIADQVRAADLNDLSRTLGDAARRNPLMFVAGAALAGFAATRFLKARDPNPAHVADAGQDPGPARAFPKARNIPKIAPLNGGRSDL